MQNRGGELGKHGPDVRASNGAGVTCFPVRQHVRVTRLDACFQDLFFLLANSSTYLEAITANVVPLDADAAGAARRLPLDLGLGGPPTEARWLAHVPRLN